MAIVYGPRVSPSLDLNFARNKSLVDTMTGRNLISFSRVQSGSSKSSYFGADGVLKYADSNEPRFDHDPATGESLGLLVEEARTNDLYPSTPDFGGGSGSWSNSAPLIANAGIAPDGTYTAVLTAWDTVSGAERLYYNTGTPSSVGVTEVHSFFVKAKTPGSGDVFSVTFQGVNWSWLNGTSSSKSFYFNFDTETFSANTNTGYGQVVTKFPNGWYRISIPAINNGTGVWNTYVAINRHEQVGNWYIWGCQREDGSFPTSYIPTPATFVSRTDSTQGASYYDANGIIQYTALGAARDNAYFPDENGVMRPAGLLLEPTSTNFVTNSSALHNWPTTFGPIVTSNATAAPDTTVTATSLVPASNNYNQIFLPVSNNEKSLSVFAKANGYDHVILVAQSTPTTSAGVLFNLTGNGSVVSTNYGATGSIQKLANGWYRCIMTRSATDTATMNAFIIRAADSSIPSGSYWFQSSFLGDGSSGIYIWGAQLEAGSYATSYIPTDGTPGGITRAADVSSSSTIQRTADVAQITGSNFSSWYNQSEGSFFLHERNSYGIFLNHRFELNQNSSPNTNTITFAVNYSNGIRILSRDSNTTGTIDRTIANVWTQGGSHKFACGLEENNFSVVSGINVATDTSGIFPANLDSLSFGADPRATALSNGAGKVSISRLTYYPERLPNTTLQKLTR